MIRGNARSSPRCRRNLRPQATSTAASARAPQPTTIMTGAATAAPQGPSQLRTGSSVADTHEGSVGE